MLRDISICLSAQQLAKIASKHKLSYVLFTMKIFIAFPNALKAQKFAVEKIIKVYLHNYGVLHIITGFLQCCGVVLCHLQLLCLRPSSLYTKWTT